LIVGIGWEWAYSGASWHRPGRMDTGKHTPHPKAGQGPGGQEPGRPEHDESQDPVHVHSHDDGHATKRGAHHHNHDHGHRHDHAPARHDRAFAIGAGVNLAFALAEVAFGFATNSVALIADAIHNLGDVLGLLLGWIAIWLYRLPPSPRRTYGWGRFSIFAALGNATILLVSVGAIGVEAIHRLQAPAPVASGLVMAVAAFGILVNGGSALLFLRGRHADLNIRAQYLHLVADAAVSAGVVLAALGMRLTGWDWLDPVTSLVIAAVIAHSTWDSLHEASALVMDAVPSGVSRGAVNDWLTSLPGVTEVHDLHIWALSTTETALTVHLVCAGVPEDRRPHDLARELRRRFGIGHATVQIESDADAALCHLRPNDVV
jgi:cobalt-zinc-cadmium efflux system protein